MLCAPCCVRGILGVPSISPPSLRQSAKGNAYPEARRRPLRRALSIKSVFARKKFHAI